MANAADGIYYVSTKGDDINGDGLSVDTAFLTIQKALDKLGQNPGRIQLMAGTFKSPQAGILLGMQQSIHGVGGQATTITFDSLDKKLTDCGLHLSGGESAARDLWLRATVGVKDIRMVRISCLWNGSTHNVRIDNILVESGVGCTAFAIGDVSVVKGQTLFQLDAKTGLPRIADRDSSDVAQVCLTHCFSLGIWKDPTSTHIQTGAGTGNVLDISSFGGGSAQNGHAIEIRGGALVSKGMSMGYSAVSDIFLSANAEGVVDISAGRSESSVRFLVAQSGGFGGSSCKVSDYSVLALQNTDGQGIQLNNEPITLENLTLLGEHAPQYIAMASVTDGVFVSPVSVTNCVSQHPYPLRSPWSRPGKIFHVQGQKLVGDSQFQLHLRKFPTHWTRRLNVPPASGAPLPASPLDPAFFDNLDVRLSSKSKPFVLGPGVPGQTLTICFVQDGIGGHAYAWPASCAFDGGSAPANVFASRNRQTCSFRWTGRFWEQQGQVTNVVPPVPPNNPVIDKFTGLRHPLQSANPFGLGAPDGGGLPAVSAFDWEHVPGGGSLGLVPGNKGMCVCNCLGWVGDNEADGFGLVNYAGAAAVIETGMKTTKKGIEAKFKWQLAEGIIAHYLDDQTFCHLYLTESTLNVRGYSHGVMASGSGFGNAPLLSPKTLKPVKLKPGSTHTLLVECNSKGFLVKLDDGAISIGGMVPFPVKLTSPNLENFRDLTKHGIFAASTAAAFSSFSVS